MEQFRQMLGAEMDSDDDIVTNFGDEDAENSGKKLRRSRKMPKSQTEAKSHKEQLERLREKDPEFYDFLSQHDRKLLQFSDDEGIDEDDTETDNVAIQLHKETVGHNVSKEQVISDKKVITSEMVDSWCKSIEENKNVAAVRSLMRAFRLACHYGDEEDNNSVTKFSTMPSNVFNKIMLFVLKEMDGILRELLKLPSTGGKKETIMDLMNTRQWKKYNDLVKSYIGNAFHVLNQMTDTEMISYTIRRLKFSSLFLAAFPGLLRKYIKVVLHFWGTGGGALPIVSFMFLRDLCIRLGSDCIDQIFKGVYKAYVLNCHFVNAMKLQHIQFLGNCVVELFRVDLPTAYQHAFVLIRQLAMILREALNTKTKEAFRKVYEWKFMNCLELWTSAVCAFGSEVDFKPLMYPLTQIISGVARLVPTARYFPLRLRCIRMLNRIAASTNTYIPVSLPLLDMLEMKELNKPATGGAGKAIDLRTVLKVSKPTLKTRTFQEACVFDVIEELTEHLALWSYSVAFLELSFVPLVRLRKFCNSTKVERFRKEMRQLIRQIDSNTDFVNERRKTITFLPNDTAAECFLEEEKKLGASPLSQYALTLRHRAQQRNDALTESSVLVGEKSSVFGKNIVESDGDEATEDEGGTCAFRSSWLPGNDAKVKEDSVEKKKKRKKNQRDVAVDEDIVEELVLSSDEDNSGSDTSSEMEDHNLEQVNPKEEFKKKPAAKKSKSLKSREKGKKRRVR